MILKLELTGEQKTLYFQEKTAALQDSEIVTAASDIKKIPDNKENHI